MLCFIIAKILKASLDSVSQFEKGYARNCCFSELLVNELDLHMTALTALIE